MQSNFLIDLVQSVANELLMLGCCHCTLFGMANDTRHTEDEEDINTHASVLLCHISDDIVAYC